MQKFITVKRIVEKFNYVVQNEDFANLENKITKPSINRLGVEIASQAKQIFNSEGIVGWGTVESKFLLSLKKEEQVAIFQKICSIEIPMIILSIGFNENLATNLIKYANDKKIPIIQTKFHLSEIYTNLGAFLSEYFAKEESVHGSLMIINGIGTMIIGSSGIGKSEAVLELLGKNHLFISDDTVIVKQIGENFQGKSNKITRGFLEVRGIGLVNVPLIYGLRSVKNTSKIELVIELVEGKEANELDRLGNLSLKYEILNSSLPKIQIPVQSGRSLGALIETAVNVFVSKKNGNNPLKIIQKRIKES